MNHAKSIAVFVVCCLGTIESVAQHCPGITESYLSLISVKQVEQSIRVVVEYQKTGGRQKEAYQAYLIAYLDKNADHIPAEAPNDTIDTSEVVVLHTQVIKRDDEGVYQMQFAISPDEFVRSLVAHGVLAEPGDLARVPSGFFDYPDKLRVAIFIPFLEDEQYSVLEGLPEDRHECNYSDARALLFQPLPYKFTVRRFGSESLYRVVINSDQRK